jgi:hypothetical protein
MRETRQSGSEGGGARDRSPYPYHLAGMPAGWFHGPLPSVVQFASGSSGATVDEASRFLATLFRGSTDILFDWLEKRVPRPANRFMETVLEQDLEALLHQFELR